MSTPFCKNVINLQPLYCFFLHFRVYFIKDKIHIEEMSNLARQKKDRPKLSRKTILMLIGAAAVFIAASIAMLPLIRLLSSKTGQEIIIEKMQDFGIFAPLLYVLLQVVQVVIAVIPGGPIPMIGGVLFGEWGALALSLAGFFLGTVIVYYLVKWIGRPIVDRFVSEKHFKKFDFLLEERRIALLIFIVFLLPGLPKDVLTYLISFNPKVKPMHLFLLTTLGRTPATILTVFLGGSLWDGNYKLAIILSALILIFACGGFFVKKYVDKKTEHNTKHKKKNSHDTCD